VRAAQITELGALPIVGDVPAPSPEGREVLDVVAVALNPLDLAIAAGRFYGGHPPLPYVPGCEAVARTAAGERVYVFGDGLGISRDGTLSEQTTVAADRLVPVPEGIADAQAVALGIAGLVAWTAAKRARIGSDDRVLVLGASGASGLVAVQAAKALGAGRVVAAGRDLSKLERARELGADDVVALDGDLAAASGGDGPTVVIDPLWGEPIAAAVGAAARGARIVHYGQSAGPETTLTSAAVRSKELELIGVSNFSRTREELEQLYTELCGEAATGRIVIDVETFALDDADEAWRRQQAGAKSVVVL
jgi:NADPH2:quinone reductase